jgi:hypothetical protein
VFYSFPDRMMAEVLELGCWRTRPATFTEQRITVEISLQGDDTAGQNPT